MPNVAHRSGDRVLFHCPGCECAHGPTVGGTGRPVWTWNGSLEKPTFVPSILVRGTVPITDEERNRIMAGETVEVKPLVCHSFVTDGRIRFLGDCTHAMAGHTVALPEWEGT